MQEKECNRQFLTAALTRQLFNCCNKHRYQAGSLISDTEKIKLLDLILNRIISENFSKHVTRFRNSNCDYRIEFDNGSIYKIVKGSDSARGHRYNDLLIDSDLDYESRYNFGLAKVLPYRPDIENYSQKLSFEDMETRIVTLVIE